MMSTFWFERTTFATKLLKAFDLLVVQVVV